MPSAPRKRPSEPRSRIRNPLLRSQTRTRWLGKSESTRASGARFGERLKRAVGSFAHGLAGRMLFRLGRHEASRRHFEQVLHLNGDHFRAYVHLGRIAYKLGDYGGWRTYCSHARRTAPERFARLRHPFELFEPRTGWTLQLDDEVTAGEPSRASHLAIWTSPGSELDRETLLRVLDPGSDPMRTSQQPDLEPEGPDLTRGADTARSTAPSEASDSGDDPPDGRTPRSAGPMPQDPEPEPEPRDVVNHQERRRFYALGPISPQELRAVDLDELARRLSTGDR